jgi:hypothetical protein
MSNSLLRTITTRTWIVALLGCLITSVITFVLMIQHADLEAKERLR